MHRKEAVQMATWRLESANDKLPEAEAYSFVGLRGTSCGAAGATEDAADDSPAREDSRESVSSSTLSVGVSRSGGRDVLALMLSR
jgi:hypothetical protein